MRCAFININGLPQKVNTPKERQLQKFITDYDIDIMGVAEINLHWNKLRQQERWEERTAGCWEHSRVSMAYNTNDEASKVCQRGGCLQLLRNQADNSYIASGQDPTGLGRWTWTRHQGKGNVTLKVYTAYRTCPPTTNIGSSTIHKQHQRYLDKHHDTRTPREAFLEDLQQELQEASDKGDQLIVMGDFNEHVGKNSIVAFSTALNLKEAITDKHFRSKGYAPTHQKGKDPIDGIFISPTLHISQGGYLPFGEVPGDHRALWISIHYDLALGYNMYKPVRPIARRLKTNDPKSKRRFQLLYKRYIQLHSLDKQVFQLQEEMQLRPWDKQLHRKFEKIYRQRLDGIEEAERQCRKLKMGEIPWSKTLQFSMDVIQLWRTVLSRKAGTKVSTRFISRLEKRVKEKNSLKHSKTEILTYLKQAYKNYYELKKEAHKLRETWLRDLAAQKAQIEGGDQETIFNNLLHRERQRIAARRLRRVRGKILGGGLHSVKVKTNDGNYEECTDKLDIELACNEVNRQKFQQTNNTPPMQSPLVEDLGFTGTSSACQAILDGTYTPPPSVAPFTKEYLSHLKRPPNIANPPQALITTEEFQSQWKVAKEKTSAGISGLHFGHMKACAEDSVIAAFEATLCHIPYSTGYSPLEWGKSVSVMIQKKGKGNKAEDLRTIQLLEAPFNGNNKKLGRDTMACAEKNNLLSPEQYGSRQRKTAIEQAVNKRLLYDVINLQRRPSVLCSNDAKSCYDRVVHSIASMALQRLGMPPQPVTCMLTTIQDFEHHVRTTFGDSETTLINEDGLPFQGICQGNGASPTIWVAVSIPLLEMMRTAQHGVTFETPLSLETNKILGFAYVDDTDLIEGNLTNMEFTISDVMENMQVAINRWEGGLKATGGALRPEKCFVYPIDFKFDASGKVRYKDKDDIARDLTVLDENNKCCNLEQVKPSEGRETLGVYMAPDGSCHEAVQILHRKAIEWQHQIVTGHIAPAEAWQCVHSTIMKTLEYPLPALTLTKKECSKIMTPIKNAGLSQAGVCRKFPLDLVYGSKNYMGLGLTDLFDSQGLQHVTLFQQHITSPGITGQLLRAAVEWAQIHVGHSTNLFSLDYHKLGHLLPRSFIKTTWEYCWDNNISILIPTTSLDRHREGDQFIMEAISSITTPKSPTSLELEVINRCRLFLQVHRLSDITDGSGQRITKQAMQGHKDKERPRYHDWPTQRSPGTRQWRIWRRFIKLAFPLQEDKHLTEPLGAWTDNNKNSWKWFYLPTTKQVYERKGRRWKVYTRYFRNLQVKKGTLFKYVTDALILPPTTQRATIIKHHNNIRIQGWAPDVMTKKFDIYNETLSTAWIIKNTYQLPQEHRVAEAIRNRNAIAVSDGSYHPDHKKGTAAWVIHDQLTHSEVHGNNNVPGHSSVQCSHRSELSGIIGVVQHVNNICKKHSITEGQMEVGCDGEEAFRIACRYEYTPTNKISHHDIVTKLHYLIKTSPITWKFRHVRGHQDDSKALSELDIWERLNIKADSLAKIQLWDHIEEGSTLEKVPDFQTTMPLVTIRLQEQSMSISSRTLRTLHTLLSEQRSLNYWSKKHPIKQDNVDLEVIQHASKNIVTWQQRWISKWNSGICGVGVNLQRWKEQNHSQCPRCRTGEEDVHHVLHCQHEDAVSLWSTGVAEIERWMRKNKAIPGLASIVGKKLRAWQAGEISVEEVYQDDRINKIISDVEGLGWEQFCFGLIPKSWTYYQNKHLKALGRKTSGTTWLSQLVRKVWGVQKSMWEHRNTFVHKTKTSIHDKEVEAVTKAIEREFRRGLDGLPGEFVGSFRGEVEKLVNSEDIVMKQQWLASIWYARDHLRFRQNLDPEERDSLAQAFITRFNLRRRKRKRMVSFVN